MLYNHQLEVGGFMMFTQRQQKILQLLAKYESSVTSDELAKLIGVSSKTIRMDIKKIEPFLKKDVAKITISNRVGYNLEIVNKVLFWELFAAERKNILDTGSRVEYIMRRLLENALNNRIITQQELADELYVGISTLKINLKDAIKKFKKYNLEIITYKNKGIQVAGKENQLRYCISEYIFRNLNLENESGKKGNFYQNLFVGIDVKTVKNILIKVTTSYEMTLTDNSLENLLIHVLITMKRSLFQHNVFFTLQESSKIEKCKEFIIAKSIFKEIYRKLKIDITANELYYLTQHLIASQKYNDTEGQSGKFIEKLVYAMLNRVNIVAGINFLQDDNLMKWLKIHLESVIPRMRFNMNIRNEILDVIKNEYPLAFQIAIIASKVIEENEKITVSENEIGYIAIHFGAALTRMDLRNNRVKKSALIVCGGGIGTAVLLKARLEDYFKGLIDVVKTVPGYKLRLDDFDTVDMVFSTISLTYLKNLTISQKTKIISVKNLLSDKEIGNIQQKFFGTADIIKAHNIDKFFRRDCYNTNGHFVGKDEVLKYLTAQLKEKGLINSKTCKSVFEREEASPTEIGNLVAIPHPMVNDTDTSSIAVLILDKPIVWVEQNVQVVFLISIAKPEFYLWEPIFLKLFEYLVKENGVKEMINERDYTGFIKKIQKKFD